MFSARLIPQGPWRGRRYSPTTFLKILNNLGTCHYLAGGEGHYFGGEGHNFFPPCLGKGHNFFQGFLGEGHNFFKVFLLRK